MQKDVLTTDHQLQFNVYGNEPGVQISLQPLIWVTDSWMAPVVIPGTRILLPLSLGKISVTICGCIAKSPK